MSKPTVVVTRQLPQAALAPILEHCNARYWDSEEPIERSRLLEWVQGAEGLYCLLTEAIDDELLDAAGPGLRVVATMSVGYDHVDVAALRKRDIPLGNTPGVLTETTAELALALLLATARRLPEGTQAVQGGTWPSWRPMWLTGRDIHGSTVGLVGLGRIGAAFARMLGGFGCRILYTGPREKPEAAREVGATFAPMDALLQESDYVAVHCPLNEPDPLTVQRRRFPQDETERGLHQHQPRRGRRSGSALRRAGRGRDRRRRVGRHRAGASAGRSPVGLAGQLCHSAPHWQRHRRHAHEDGSDDDRESARRGRGPTVAESGRILSARPPYRNSAFVARAATVYSYDNERRFPNRIEKELPAMSKQTLTITDNRTGQTTELPIEHDTIPAIGLRQFKVQADDFGMLAYDPGYTNTASCKSRITFVDGDRGILRYRGYPIEQLAEESTFLEVAYLLLFGELPTADELTAWNARIMAHTLVHENLAAMLKAFHPDAHPMGILISAVAAMSTLYPQAKQVQDADNRLQQIWRILGQLPTAVAFADQNRLGRPRTDPDGSLDYSENFLYMLGLTRQDDGKVDPVLARAMDVLFILHADHEQNCSTSALRNIASSEADPYCAVAGAAAALYGPLHGGANEAVLRMLAEIGDTKNIPAFLERVKNRKVRLMGFGHRVYKNYDPRAQIIKRVAYEVFAVTGSNPLDRYRGRVGTQRPGGRLFHLPAALPQCGFLQWYHLPGDGVPSRNVPGALCVGADAGLAGPVG